jgi:AcrR family transcriptional regulator
MERIVSTAVETAHKTRLKGTDRREQLVSIAMDLIATHGFEGLRFQKVAKQAGINNATLYYHFPTKEALIQGVVSHLTGELKKTRRRPNDEPVTARQELRFEFRDVRELLRAQPKLFIVLIELSLRGSRDPAIDKMEKRRDGFWRDHLSSIIRRGIEQGAFRHGIHVERVVTALMAQIKGIGYHATLGAQKRCELDQAIAEIAAQVDHWLTCKSR